MFDPYGLAMLLPLIIIAGLTLSIFAGDDDLNFAKIMPPIIALIFMFAMTPTIVDVLTGGNSTIGFGTITTEIHESRVLEYKETLYKNRLFGMKEYYQFTLDNGKTYKVSQAIFDKYDTGDKVKLIKTNGKVEIK